MRTVLLTVALCLSGCGFHLRGIADGPTWLQSVTLVMQTDDSPFYLILKNQLQAAHIQVNPDLVRPDYRLVIINDTMQKNIVSISSSTTPRQYQLIYTVRFKLEDANKKARIPITPIIVTRLLTVNSDRILGSNDEERTLRHEMQRDVGIQLLNHLSQPIISNYHVAH